VRGSVTKVAIPDDAQLVALTKRALTDARVPQTLLALEKAQSGLKPVPVPKHPGEPVARGQEGGQFRGTRGPGQWLRNGARNGTQRA
jgi:hypothetical protein